MLVLSDKIQRACQTDGFVGAIIYGPQRIGKSSYSAKVLHEIYGSWDQVLDHFVFDLREVVDLLGKSVETETKIPALCWDDAGVHANKMIYFSNRQLVQYLQNLLDVIGLHLGSLVITTPSPSNLLRAVRGYEFYRIKIFRRDGYNGRYGVGYLSSLLPSGSRIIHRDFKDYFNVVLPDEFWEPYLVKRRSYLKTAVSQLRAFLEE